MTPTEATFVAKLLCQMWPYPELDETGLEMLVIAMADTGLTLNEAKQGIRALMQQDHRFRPQPCDLTQAAKPPKYAAAYHRPFHETAGELPPPPENKTVGREAFAAMRARMALIGHPDTRTPKNTP